MLILGSHKSPPLTQPLDITLSGNFHASHSPSKIPLILQSPTQTSSSLCSETDKHTAMSRQSEFAVGEKQPFFYYYFYISLVSPAILHISWAQGPHLSLLLESQLEFSTEEFSKYQFRKRIWMKLWLARAHFEAHGKMKSRRSYHHTRHSDSRPWNLHSHWPTGPWTQEQWLPSARGDFEWWCEGCGSRVAVAPGLQETNAWILALSSQHLLHSYFTQNYPRAK